ncbi:uncharacterized protein LOC116180908 [Photinus pyralis]|nr:uncharacterized protein LOC116180908 [Photinus pyralis]
MEFISSARLDKYKSILDQIDSEYKKHELLSKKFEKITNQLAAVRLTTEKPLSTDICKVFVKVYDSVFDLFFLYGDEEAQLELESLSKFRDCKFYVVEVSISQALLRKFTSRNCILHASVKNGRLSVSKSVSVSKQHPNNLHLIVVPFDCSAEDATVTAALHVNHDSTWSTLPLSTVAVDVSYHFTTRRCLFQDNPVMQIAKRYNRVFAERVVEYCFRCECSTRHFFKSVVKNCYHRLDPEILTLLTGKSAPVTSVDFYVRGEQKGTLKVDRTQSTLTVSCGVYDLCAIKRYFVRQIVQEKVSVDKAWLHAFVVIKSHLQAELCERPLRAKELCSIYEELRKLVGELAI